jgi:hypothetical protein
LFVLESLRALGGMVGFLAVLAFVRLSTVYGAGFEQTSEAPPLRQDTWGRVRRLLGTSWVWVALAGSVMASLALGGAGKTFPHWTLAPVYLLLVLCVFRLWTSALNTDADARARGIWIVHGAIGFLVGLGLTDVVRMSFPSAVHLWALPEVAGSMFAVFAVGYAVLWKGVAGDSLVIRRGTVYGLLGIAAVFLYSGIEEVLTSWVANATGLPGGIGSFAAAGVMAVLIGPLRSRIPGLERAQPRESDEA